MGQSTRARSLSVVVGMLVAATIACAAVVVMDHRDGSVARLRASSGGSVRTSDGVLVRFPPMSLSRDTTVRVRAVSSPALPDTVLASPFVDVDLGGARLDYPAQVTLPLHLPDGLPSRWAFVADRGGDGRWTNLGGVSDAHERSITATLLHFSRVGTFVPTFADPVAAGNAILQTVRAGMDFDWTAEPPACTPASARWATTDAGEHAVRACVEASGPWSATVRVRNNRTWPQFLHLAGTPLPVVDVGETDDYLGLVWTRLATLHPDHTFLPGGGPASDGEASYGVPATMLRVDVGVQPAVEAVVARFFAEVMKLWRIPPPVAAGILGCLVEQRVLADARHPDRILGAFRACLGTGSEPLRAAPGAVLDARVVEQLTDVAGSLRGVARSLTQGIGGRGARQHVVSRRHPLVPERALLESGRLPRAVLRRQAGIQRAAAAYGRDGGALARLLPRTGLLFANAADPPAAGRLAGPLAARALAAVMSTPPLWTTCDEAGQVAYVYGLADPDAPTWDKNLRAAGYDDETRVMITAAARAARPYRACIRADGTWLTFSKSTARFPGASVEALAPTPPGADCPAAPANPFVPPDAACVNVLSLQLDGDGRADRLLLFRRGTGKPLLVARALLAAGAASDVEVARASGRAVRRPEVDTHLDLDGRPGEEALVLVAPGGTRRSALLTVMGRSLREVTDAGRAHEVPSAGSARRARTLTCPDVTGDGRPELVESTWTAERDPDDDERVVGWSERRSVYAWTGASLTPVRVLEAYHKGARGQPDPLACRQPVRRGLVPGPARTPAAAVTGLLEAWRRGDPAAIGAYAGSRSLPEDTGMRRLLAKRGLAAGVSQSGACERKRSPEGAPAGSSSFACPLRTPGGRGTVVVEGSRRWGYLVQDIRFPDAGQAG